MSWRLTAACRHLQNPAMFSSESPEDIKHAKQYCTDCTVSDACLDDALNRQAHGIWGATTKPERDAILISQGRIVIRHPSDAARVAALDTIAAGEQITSAGLSRIADVTRRVARSTLAKMYRDGDVDRISTLRIADKATYEEFSYVKRSTHAGTE